ncbi:electron transport complex subunit RsxC [Candidatus Enterovibrio altilux]|uniref:electron transport complex subunit RsxC n=1 Tax=Candidatus Enterovibrio altilux TaxID=1927128 RepID=UPI001237D1E5|nr:electron transport complex subunit RsxC [Candidatus Enterovibrio luxaltus]
MNTLLQQIKDGRIWDFQGGIHPPENKRQSSKVSIASVEIPSKIVLPLKQHIGTSGKVLVNIGDRVLKGEPLTKSAVFQCCPVHASTSGEIIAIEVRPIAHPSGLSDTCIEICPDLDDKWVSKNSITEYLDVSAENLIDHVHSMGISGMGGAGFPAASKLQTGLECTEILIINGAECEPYMTANDRLMQEHADEIIQGIEIVQHIIKPQLTVLAVEDNKSNAITALKKAIGNKQDIFVQVIPTKYPSGSEKQLINLITGKEVPTKGIPANIGVLMQNVGTVLAIKRAIIDGEPMIQRVVTITGTTLREPCNRWVLLGTPVCFLLEKHGYQPDKQLERLIIGGPMMGFTVPHSDLPVTKVTNCVLVPSRREITPYLGEIACIRCRICAEVCPISLLPQQLQWYARYNDFDKCEEYNLFDCIECGACAYACPSKIPLVQYYRQAKAEIRHHNAKKVAAVRAKQRFEAKKQRMEIEQQQHEAQHKKAAANRHKTMETLSDDEVIAAMLARMKAKFKQNKAANDVKLMVIDVITPAIQAEVAAKDQTEADNS